MGSQKCRVCDEALSKYKCPSCLAPYCSLGCFKKHKEIPCAKPLSPEKETSPARESSSDRPLRVDTPDCVIQQVLLESLASSRDIREALKDRGLREFIWKIDSSADAETISLSPLFITFKKIMAELFQNLLHIRNSIKQWKWRTFVCSQRRYYLLSHEAKKLLR